MAMHAKAQILPWVDNIVSRMIYYFTCGPWVSWGQRGQRGQQGIAGHLTCAHVLPKAGLTEAWPGRACRGLLPHC